jgi:glycosyltransferase involved in cell wall biosynthesis
MHALIIIPAYNEEGNLSRLLTRIKQTCPGYDIIVINDCSSDRSSEICKDMGIEMISLPVNLGIGGAVQTGYKYAYCNNYNIAVQVDGDGQHDPQYISLLVSGLEKGSNLCIGSRFINREGFQSTPARRIGIKYFSNLIKIFTGCTITDPTSGFRACDRKTIKMFAREYPGDYPEPETIVNAKKSKLTISEVPVVMSRREEGKSSITGIRSIYYMIKVSLAIIIASFYKNERLEETDQ